MCKFNILKSNKHNSDCVTPFKTLQCLFTTFRLKSKLTMGHMVLCDLATVTISPSSPTILPVPYYVHSPSCHSSSTCSHFRAFALAGPMLRRFFPQVFTRLAPSLHSLTFPDSVPAHIRSPALLSSYTGIVYLFTTYQPHQKVSTVKASTLSVTSISVLPEPGLAPGSV